MKIIIDGCDLTGKTTLIKKIKDYYNDDRLSTLHFSYRDRTDYEFYNTMLCKDNFISDRHFLDEIIYPEIFNRYPNLTINQFNLLIERCKEENIKIIILACSDDELLKRSKTRNEEKEVAENLLKINRKFIKLAKDYNLYLVDTTKVSFEEIIDYIEGK